MPPSPHLGTALTKREDKKKRKTGREKKRREGRGRKQRRGIQGGGEERAETSVGLSVGKGAISREMCGPCGLSLI